MNATFDKQLDKFIQEKAIIPKGFGLWERYFRQICTAWGRIDGEIRPRHIIFCADNGCNMAGHVGYNYEVTRKQSVNMLLGNNAIAHFCKFNGIPYDVVDVGIACDESIGIGRKVAKGTRDILYGPAMTDEEFERAFQAGRDLVCQYVSEEYNLFSFGEMGLGNTSTSAAVLAALTGYSPNDTVGPGSWPDKPDLMQRKRDFVQAVLDARKGGTDTAEHIVADMGGFDIAALMGAMTACADSHIPFVIDGFITAVAAACASRLRHELKQYVIPSHYSRERGMEIALAEIGITPQDVPIQAQMAMGEGTGAVMMVQLLKTTQYMFANVGTMAELMRL